MKGSRGLQTVIESVKKHNPTPFIFIALSGFLATLKMLFSPEGPFSYYIFRRAENPFRLLPSSLILFCRGLKNEE